MEEPDESLMADLWMSDFLLKLIHVLYQTSEIEKSDIKIYKSAFHL
jgi:hypothetical protein